jgi:hypothetical protein
VTPRLPSRLPAAFSVALCLASATTASVAISPAPSALLNKTRAAHVSTTNIPLSFEPNRGQTSPQVQWLSRGPEFTLFLAGHDAVLEMNTITPGKESGRSAQGDQHRSAYEPARGQCRQTSRRRVSTPGHGELLHRQRPGALAAGGPHLRQGRPAVGLSRCRPALFSNDGHTLLYSTFLGSTTDTQFNDFSQALSLGTNGIAFVVQKAAAMRTVAWMSRSVAPYRRAVSI